MQDLKIESSPVYSYFTKSSFTQISIKNYSHVCLIAVNSHRYRTDKEITNIAFVLSRDHQTNEEREKNAELLREKLFSDVKFEIRPYGLIRNSKAGETIEKNKMNSFSVELCKMRLVVERLREQEMINGEEKQAIEENIEELEYCLEIHKKISDTCTERQKQMIEEWAFPFIKGLAVKNKVFLDFSLKFLESLPGVDNLSAYTDEKFFSQAIYKLTRDPYSLVKYSGEDLGALFVLMRMCSGTAGIEKELLKVADTLPNLELQVKIIRELVDREKKLQEENSINEILILPPKENQSHKFFSFAEVRDEFFKAIDHCSEPVKKYVTSAFSQYYAGGLALTQGKRCLGNIESMLTCIDNLSTMSYLKVKKHEPGYIRKCLLNCWGKYDPTVLEKHK